jgi:hypothetical protein
MRKLFTAVLLSGVLLSSCDDDDDKKAPDEDPSAFSEIGGIQLTGGETAAEISAYDPKTKRLFVVNAVKAAIDVINMEDPAALVYEDEISIDGYGGGVNSVAIRNGLLAAAIEADPKTDPGKVVVWNTADMSEKAVVTVGALPDMVTFSADGKYIVSANEGEPSEDYAIDPNGSVSIIDVQSGFSVTTLDFTGFNSATSTLMNKGYRIVGTDIDLAHDTEPEYISITEDSQTAFVTLQETMPLPGSTCSLRPSRRFFQWVSRTTIHRETNSIPAIATMLLRLPPIPYTAFICLMLLLFLSRERRLI